MTVSPSDAPSGDPALFASAREPKPSPSVPMRVSAPAAAPNHRGQDECHSSVGSTDRASRTARVDFDRRTSPAPDHTPPRLRARCPTGRAEFPHMRRRRHETAPAAGVHDPAVRWRGRSASTFVHERVRAPEAPRRRRTAGRRSERARSRRWTGNMGKTRALGTEKRPSARVTRGTYWDLSYLPRVVTR